MSVLPGLVNFPRPARRVTVAKYPREEAEEVVILAGQIDSGNSAFRTSFMRPGMVLVEHTDGSGKYVVATDSNAKHQTAASVATLITNPGAGGWDGDVVISGHWGSLTVALSGADTDAAVAAAIIAAAAALNPESQAPITAADTTGEVTITNIDKGAGTWLKATHATVATMFGAAGQSDYGEDPDVLVTEKYVDMLNGAGTSVDSASGEVLRVGAFDAPNLINLTAETAAVLLKRGSRLVGTATLAG
jgi:hypothetical protein